MAVSLLLSPGGCARTRQRSLAQSVVWGWGPPRAMPAAPAPACADRFRVVDANGYIVFALCSMVLAYVCTQSAGLLLQSQL